MKIEKPFSLSGYFWLPSDEENKLYGTLKVEDGGKIELEVLGSFNKSLKDYANDDREIERIVGETEHGYVTLEKCFAITSNFRVGRGISKNRIHVSILYNKVMYEEDEIILFDTFSFSVDGLNEWLNIRKIKTDTLSNTYLIKHKEIENIEYNLVENIKLEFQIRVTTHMAHYESSMKQSSRIKLISKEKKPLKYFSEFANKIVKFLSFAIDERINIKDIKVTNSDIFRECNDKKYPIKIEVYSQIMHFFKDTFEIKSHTMLFKYTDIQESFEEKINNWINSYRIIEPALNLFFSVRYSPSQYVESEFLSLAQALETYHRQLYKTEMNLQKRLEEIINPLHEYIDSDEVREKLIENIKVTRNYYTHYDDRLINRATPCEELSHLSKKMEGILQLSFLEKIGFDEVEIRKIFDGYNGLKRKFK